MDDFEDKARQAMANPRNVGEMEDADAVGTAGSADCGSADSGSATRFCSFWSSVILRFPMRIFFYTLAYIFFALL